MSVIFLLIPLSVVIATGFLLAFIWAVRSGQYEDTCTPAIRMLLQDRKTSVPAVGAVTRESDSPSVLESAANNLHAQPKPNSVSPLVTDSMKGKP